MSRLRTGRPYGWRFNHPEFLTPLRPVGAVREPPLRVVSVVPNFSTPLRRHSGLIVYFVNNLLFVRFLRKTLYPESRKERLCVVFRYNFQTITSSLAADKYQFRALVYGSFVVIPHLLFDRKSGLKEQVSHLIFKIIF